MSASRMAVSSLFRLKKRQTLLVPCESTRDNECKLKYRKFHLYVGKNFSHIRVTEHRHGLPGEVVECPSLEIFRRGLGTVLSNLL